VSETLCHIQLAAITENLRIGDLFQAPQQPFSKWSNVTGPNPDDIFGPAKP
jgi:hypothetical protein